jgi:ribokinase
MKHKEEGENLPLSIITLGNITIDIIAYNTQKDIVIPCSTKQPVDHIQYSLGGGACNSAFVFAKHHANVSPIATIGNDTWKNFILTTLQQHNIATTLLISKQSNSKISLIFPSQQTNTSIVSHYNSNHAISLSEINFESFKQANMLYITSVHLQNPKQLTDVFLHAKKNNLAVACNPGVHFLTTHKNVLLVNMHMIDIFICNQKELALLLQPTSIEQGMQQLHTWGVKIVIVTCDKDGAYLSNNQSIIQQPAPTCNPINTTGAGDAFGATFAILWLQKKSLNHAFNKAMQAAQQVIASHTSHINMQQPTKLQQNA